MLPSARRPEREPRGAGELPAAKAEEEADADEEAAAEEEEE